VADETVLNIVHKKIKKIRQKNKKCLDVEGRRKNSTSRRIG
jgi:hypothetical protein